MNAWFLLQNTLTVSVTGSTVPVSVEMHSSPLVLCTKVTFDVIVLASPISTDIAAYDLRAKPVIVLRQSCFPCKRIIQIALGVQEEPFSGVLSCTYVSCPVEHFIRLFNWSSSALSHILERLSDSRTEDLKTSLSQTNCNRLV